MKSTGYQVQEFTANSWTNLCSEYGSWADALHHLHLYAWRNYQYRIVKTTTIVLSTGIYPKDFQLDELNEELDF